MRFQKTLKISAAILFVILFSGFFTGSSDPYFEISKNIELFGRVYKEISFNYVDEVDPENFMRAGIEGMLKSLDPYTIFVDEEKLDKVSEQPAFPILEKPFTCDLLKKTVTKILD